MFVVKSVNKPTQMYPEEVTHRQQMKNSNHSAATIISIIPGKSKYILSRLKHLNTKITLLLLIILGQFESHDMLPSFPTFLEAMEGRKVGRVLEFMRWLNLSMRDDFLVGDIVDRGEEPRVSPVQMK